MPSTSTDPDGPYVALDSTHLARWRGHALARFADPEAVEILTAALDRLDATYTRAETALRVDLATALGAIGQQEAVKLELDRAARLASIIGSARQQRRIRTLARLRHEANLTDLAGAAPHGLPQTAQQLR